MRKTGSVFYSESRSIPLQGEPCVECGEKAEVMHHIIPFSKSGKCMVHLCATCHNKVHGLNQSDISNLIKAGLKKAKAKGVKLGATKKINEAEIINKFKQGLSQRKIAIDLKCSKTSVQKTIFDYLLSEQINVYVSK